MNYKEPNTLRFAEILGKRFLVIGGTLILLYAIIGSFIFPDWYYQIFWNGGFADVGVWQEGVDYWIQTPLLLLGVAALAIVASLLVHRYRSRFWPLVDRRWKWVVSVVVFGMLMTALAVREYGRLTYRPVDQIIALNQAIQRLQGTPPPQPPAIQPPIDFEYLDRDRVQALYNQIQPELVESKRTVDAGTSLNADAGVKAGPIIAEAGASKRDESASTFERLHYSPERQCVEVMNFVLKRYQARYYTDGSSWISQRVASRFQQQVDQLKKNFTVITKDKIEQQLPLEVPVGEPTKEEQAAAQQQLKLFEDEFNGELKSLQGMVIIDGDFTPSRSAQGDSALVERFSDRPRRVVFRVVVPPTPETSKIISIGKTHLRVFGTVLRPLGDDGVIEVRPLAIY